MNEQNDDQARDQIIQMLKLVTEPGQVVELRALGVSVSGYSTLRTVVGFFDSIDALAAEAVKLIPSAKGIYFTINPVAPELLARCANQVQLASSGSCASAQNIVCRRLLLVDLDPVRPSDISSTDAEHEAAIAKARSIKAELQDKGWPDPIITDSGNGTHLLFRVDLPCDDGDLIKRTLKALAFWFNDEAVVIDEAVCDPSRLCKLPGTLARKGDSTSERPHRRAKILEHPQNLLPISKNLLEVFVNTLPEDDGGSQCSKSMFDLEKWIIEHDLDVTGPIQWKDGSKWIFNVCPWNPEHTNRSAFILRFPSGAVAAGCLHNSCRDHNWQSLRKLYDPEWQDSSGSDESSMKRGKESQADQLVQLAEQSGIELFHNEFGRAFARIPIDGHMEIRRVTGNHFEEWLRLLFWDCYEKVPNKDAVTRAIEMLDARAKRYGKEYSVCTRVAFCDGFFYYDLCNEQWQAVKIGPDGWELIDNPPILFQRHIHQKPQVLPVRGGNIQELLRLVNLRDRSDYLLLLVMLASYLVPGIPHCILILHGSHGTAKTTLFRVIRRLIDPSAIEVLALPNNTDQLVQQLDHHWLPLYDNLSYLPDPISNMLCRAVTGEGVSRRALYTNDDDIIFSYRRCIGLNGINVAASKADLLDRSVLIGLEPIAPETRRQEQQFWQEFEDMRPLLVGALFDILSLAMKLYPEVKLDSYPRMADFAAWGVAITQAMGEDPAEFLAAFGSNEKARNAEALDANPVATAVIAFMEDKASWTGNAAHLLAALRDVAATVGISTINRTWPKNAHLLSRKLNEAQANLAAVGIIVERPTRTAKQRLITIRKTVDSNVTRVTCVTSDTGDPGITQVHVILNPSPDGDGFDETELAPKNDDEKDSDDANDADDNNSASFAE